MWYFISELEGMCHSFTIPLNGLLSSTTDFPRPSGIHIRPVRSENANDAYDTSAGLPNVTGGFSAVGNN